MPASRAISNTTKERQTRRQRVRLARRSASDWPHRAYQGLGERPPSRIPCHHGLACRASRAAGIDARMVRRCQSRLHRRQDQGAAELKVLGPNATATEQIDLSYNPEYGDTKTGNTVTLKRAFCVQTGGDGFELQLANTTNITGLTIELYKAEDTGPGDAPDVRGIAGGKPYSWKMYETDLLKSFTPIEDPARAQATLHSRTIKTSSATRVRSTDTRNSAKANSTLRRSTARLATTRLTSSSSFRGTRAPKRPT